MVKFRSESGHVYEVTAHSCTCGDYLHRQIRVGGKCKHMIKLFYPHLIKLLKTNPKKAKASPDEPVVSLNDEQTKYFELEPIIDDAYDKYGDDVIKRLLDSYEIIQLDGKFIILK